MDALIIKDEYGALRSVNEWNCAVWLPKNLSVLLELSVKSMRSFDRNLYLPDSEHWQ